MRSILSGLALGVVLLAGSFTADAQQQAKLSRIGWLGTRSASALARELFQQELRALGYLEGKNIAFEYRYAEGNFDRLPALADELVRLKLDVLVAPATLAAVAAKNATRTIPIVFYSGSDPVANELVVSLARPGGNVTGFTTAADVLAGKRLELLKDYSQALPRWGVVESTGVIVRPTMERESTAGTTIGPAASFHGGEQR
jgi:putative tryptophan/tyrosine transport system substrate-binding protein